MEVAVEDCLPSNVGSVFVALPGEHVDRDRCEFDADREEAGHGSSGPERVGELSGRRGSSFSTAAQAVSCTCPTRLASLLMSTPPRN